MSSRDQHGYTRTPHTVVRPAVTVDVGYDEFRAQLGAPVPPELSA